MYVDIIPSPPQFLFSTPQKPSPYTPLTATVATVHPAGLGPATTTTTTTTARAGKNTTRVSSPRDHQSGRHSHPVHTQLLVDTLFGKALKATRDKSTAILIRPLGRHSLSIKGNCGRVLPFRTSRQCRYYN